MLAEKVESHPHRQRQVSRRYIKVLNRELNADGQSAVTLTLSRYVSAASMLGRDVPRSESQLACIIVG